MVDTKIKLKLDSGDVAPEEAADHKHGDSCSGGHHNHSHGADATVKALLIALALNFGFLIIELVAGLLTNSLALLSDAGHMVSDVAALALALVAQRLAARAPGGSFTFGLKRLPVLGAFGNALALLVIVALIFHEAWLRLYNPPTVAGMPVLIVGIAGLIVNVVSAWKLHSSGDHSHNVRGAMLHMFADALGSVGAIISAAVIMATGWMPIDSIASLAIGLLILIGTWPLLRDTAKVLLQAAPPNINMKKLREILVSNDAIERIADLHVWELNTGQMVLTATLITDCRPLCEMSKVSCSLRADLVKEFGIGHSTFEWLTPENDEIGCEPKD